MRCALNGSRIVFENLGRSWSFVSLSFLVYVALMAKALIYETLTLLPSKKQIGRSAEFLLFSTRSSFGSSSVSLLFFFFLTLSTQRRPIFFTPTMSVLCFDTSIALQKFTGWLLAVSSDRRSLRSLAFAWSWEPSNLGIHPNVINASKMPPFWLIKLVSEFMFGHPMCHFL